MSRLSRYVLGLALAIALADCATWQPPHAVDTAAMRAHAVTESRRGVRVSAALVDAQASKAMFGAYQANVQPVWLEVENGTSQPLWLLRTGADPDYFSPLEVAWAMHRPLSGNTNARIDDHVASLAFANPIAPGATNTGVIFIHPQPVTVLLNLDLFGSATFLPFSLFLRHASAPPMFQYPETAITEYRDLATFRSALEGLPCCATDVDGTKWGDPLNTVFVGNLADIAAACLRRNYRLDRRDYDRAQHVFGREPDIVGRRLAQAGGPATWIRVWLAPMRFDGKSVYVAQVGRPVGGRFIPRDALDMILHEDVDEARNYLVQGMMYSGGLDKFGFVTGVGDVRFSSPRTVFNGARYHTDGLRAVLFFGTRPLSLSDVEFLAWEPFLERREGAARARSTDAHD